MASSTAQAISVDETIIVDPRPWLSLPATPTLPSPNTGFYAPINGIKMWYNTYGVEKPGQVPIVLLHGGMGNANYFGDLVRRLETHHRVIVAESRGHGRSTWGNVDMSYDLMGSDYVALLEYLKIEKAALAGWSDGGIIAFMVAATIPERVDRVFAFAAHYSHTNIFDVTLNPVFMAYLNRSAFEYSALSPHPSEYDAFSASIRKMWGTQPTWDASRFSNINGRSTWIVGAQHDEGIKPGTNETMCSWLPDSGLMMLPQVSHFAFLQNLNLYATVLEEFLRADLSP